MNKSMIKVWKQKWQHFMKWMSRTGKWGCECGLALGVSVQWLVLPLSKRGGAREVQIAGDRQVKDNGSDLI